LGAAFVRGYNAVVDEAQAAAGFAQHNLKKGQGTYRGLGAATGTYAGTARVLLDASDYPSLRPGAASSDRSVFSREFRLKM